MASLLRRSEHLIRNEIGSLASSARGKGTVLRLPAAPMLLFASSIRHVSIQTFLTRQYKNTADVRAN